MLKVFFLRISWVPAYFTNNFEAYANQVCWVSNTYYVNQSEPLSRSDDLKKSTEIKYYQWIPVSSID
jgi:innexin